jgi:hypothetical protein
LTLLLDEPGLSLHASAQGDLLKFIDYLSEKHQIVYTTHSPFMIRNDSLHRARMVEDRADTGTTVSGNLSGSNSKTLLPLQAALGYSMAQNLLIKSRNLLVEGPGDLVFLRFVSNILEAAGRVGIRGDLAIVPAGGLDKVATFVALLGGNDLELVVLHDYSGAPDQRIQSLVHQKILRDKRVVTYAEFRGGPVKATDIEDLFEVDEYLAYFNDTFKKTLPNPLTAAVLPAGDRIVQRLESYLTTHSIATRPSAGFNHYAVANNLLVSGITALHVATLNRFEALFKRVNGLFSKE